MIFVDTGAWYSAAVANDPDHAKAVEWFEHNQEQLLTTDYILDEVITLLRAHHQRRLAVDVGRSLLDQQFASLYLIESDDIARAFEIVERFSDKEWSFTDCTSYVVMARFNIRTAFSFDHHFRQFGTVTVTVVPEKQ